MSDAKSPLLFWIRKIVEGKLQKSLGFSLWLLSALFLPRTRRLSKNLQFVGQTNSSATIFVNVSKTALPGLKTGIGRTVTQIAFALFELGCRDLLFVRLSPLGELTVAEDYEELHHTRAERVRAEGIVFRPGDFFLELDLSLPPHHLPLSIVKTLRAHGVQVIFLMYDLLPITHPQLFKKGKSVVFRLWLLSAIAADQIWSISNSTVGELRPFLAAQSNLNPEIAKIPLGSNPLPAPQSKPSNSQRETQLTVLMVGTIEPRKGYKEALGVFKELWESGFQVKLEIVGQRGWKCNDVVREISRLQRAGFPLTWSSHCSDGELAQKYVTAHLLLANSLAEGFGLPLVEAMTIGLPIAARDINVFREVAGEHAKFYSDQEGLRSILLELASDGHFFNQPSEPAPQAPLNDWRDTAAWVLAKVRES